MMPFTRNRRIKCLCARCHAQCDDGKYDFKRCEGCSRYFHHKCLMKSKKYSLKNLNNTSVFYCSKKCELSVFPFNLVRDKEYAKINANEIKDPCTKCGGECHRFDIIQCDECDKWTHLVCTDLTKEQFDDLGQSSDSFYCSKKCELKVFPFSGISNRVFFEKKDDAIRSIRNVSENSVSERDLATSAEIDEDEPNPQCYYLDEDQIHEIGLFHGTKDLTIFHNNVGSLSKNVKKIEDLFRDQQKLPDIMGVTETRLLDNKDIPANIELTGYDFEHCPTKTSAGGAGIYIANYLDYEIRNDLNLNLERCEDIWVNLKLKKKSKNDKTDELVVGVIYRHPGSQIKEFENKICSIVNALNQSKSNFVIVGDININSLKMNIVQNITDYFINLQGAGCLSLVDRATRVVRRGNKYQSSCLDHTYTNLNIDNIESNIITSDISDHYSTIIKIKDITNIHIPKHDVYVRKKVLSPSELIDLNMELQVELDKINITNSNINEATETIIVTYQKILDKYIPFEKLTRKEKGFYYKPWLTKGVKESMKTRQHLKTKAMKDKTEESDKYYKRYKNFVTRLQNIAYSNYYSQKVNKNFKNKKKLWETVGEITKYKKKKTH